MRRKDREITDRAELLRILAKARVCRLALVDGDRPYVVPLTFALDGADLVLHSARTGRKLDILRRNPAVCFEVEEGVEINGGRDQRRAPRCGAPDRPLPANEVERTAVLRIRVRELTGKRCPA
jgi:hypothetical protein